MRSDPARIISELVLSHAEVRGDQIAFQDGDRSVDYRQLERRTRSLAGRLGAEWLKPGDRAAVLLGNRVEVVESYVALARAAAVAVPLNPSLPDAELSHALRDSDCRVVISDRSHADQLRRVATDEGAPAVVIVGDTGVPEGSVSFEALADPDTPAPAPRDDLAPEDVAWIFYSSGTTGRPKGVRLRQGSPLWAVNASYVAILDLTDADRMLIPIPLFHAFGFNMCLGALAGGTTARVTTGFDPGEVLDLHAAESYSFISGVPAMYHQLVATARERGAVPTGPRVCIVGGAPTSAKLRTSWQETFRVPLVDVYGATEICGANTINWPVDDPSVETCGVPLPGLEVRLVDPDTGADVPPGEEGEMWFRGPSVMAGYHNMPEETAATLVDGWYRTGDLARRGPSGHLTLTGRISELVIRGGENIHPTEVEQVIARVPGIADVAVAAKDHEELGQVPVAFVVAAGGEVDFQAVVDTCRTHLAPFKVPAEIRQLDAIPRNGSGKILRRMLWERSSRLLGSPEPTAARQPRQAATTDGDAELRHRLSTLIPSRREDLLTGIVLAETRKFLGIERPAEIAPEISGDSAFVDLGLPSVGAVRLRNRLTEVTGIELPATLVYDYPDPRAVAHRLCQLMGLSPAESTATRHENQVDDDPIAIVGMACRYPGGTATVDDLWKLVRAGEDGTSDFPADRGWDIEAVYDPDGARRGTTYTRRGGFLDGVADFDAGFFGISPREALTMDPQQRILLETSWEALEHAGINAQTLKGSRTGVFAGLMYHDYADSANLGSLVSGRIAYTLGLEGPAITVDTACSSSLVALHLAVRALRSGECSLALAGGVAVMATPSSFVEFSRQQALSKDGRCKSFASAADGTAWAEGVGVLVVERLSDARRHGHRVLAVVKGSAVNQDGASNGMAAPNGPAQERVIRAALASAGLSAAEVDAVEAHGTGTTLGDPIEAQALLATYGQDRPDGQPLWLGSVKSNIGHTQAAAGVAGVIKMVQAMRHGVLPRTLHVDEPSSHVDWTSGAVSLLTEAMPWPATGRPRRAGVSSFGISGTNAHVILEEARPEAGTSPDTVDTPGTASWPVVPWVLSGKTAPALRRQAARLLDRVTSDAGLDPVDVGFSLATGRAVLEHRAVVLGRDRGELLAAVRAFATGEGPVPGVVTGTAKARPAVAFLFPGQGAQWAGMGRELLASSPVFAARMAECEQALRDHVDWSLLDVVRGTAGAPGLDRVDVVQPVSFAVMVSLAALWRSLGVEPAAVAGHSQGEIAAACVAGALTLEEAARVVALRSAALVALSGKGEMVSVRLPADQVRARVSAWGERLSVAAVNGPSSTVVSGDPGAVAELMARCADEDVRARRITVDYASHSAQMEQIEAELSQALGTLRPRAADIPFYSTVSGQRCDTTELDAGYWYRNLRHTVEFEQATKALLDQGIGMFVEVSPHPVLLPSVQETIDAAGAAARTADTLRRDEGDLARVAASAAELFTLGVPVAWDRLLTGGTRVELPAYAFERRRFWQHTQSDVDSAVSLGLAPADHPLLGAAVVLPEDEGVILTGRVSIASHPWLADHAVRGLVLVPGTAFVEMALRAGEGVGCPRIRELVLEAPLVLPEHGGAQVQVKVGAEHPDGTRPFTVHSSPSSRQRAGEPVWTRHATGVLGGEAPAAVHDEDGPCGTVWPPRNATAVPITDFYARMADLGLDYGPAFRLVSAAWRHGDELFAEVTLRGLHWEDAQRFEIHPALLDAALHAAALGRFTSAGDGELTRLPFSFNGISLHTRGASSLRVRIAPAGPDAITVQAADPAGAAVAQIESLLLRPITPRQLATARDHGNRPETLLGLEWNLHSPTAARPEPSGWALISAGTEDGPAGVSRYDTVGELAGAVSAGVAAPRVVLLPVTVASNGTEDLLSRVRATTVQMLRSLQQWLSEETLASSRLVVLTRHAVHIGVDGDRPNLVQAPIWGMVRAAQTENPGRVTIIDTDGEPDTGWEPLLDAVASEEPQLAIRRGRIHVPRLRRQEPAASGRATSSVATALGGGTVLITGGTGGLGADLARHLAASGVPGLLLLSRRGPDAPGADTLRQELSDAGAHVTILACDVADREQLAEALTAVPAARPLTAVIHTAAVLDDGVIESLTPERFDTVLRPKADAAWHLHELTAEESLAAFVVFSSISGFVGGPGQANYAAANVFLDALVRHRREQGVPGLSLAWGMWARLTGLTGQLDQADLERLGLGGIRALSTEQGMALFDTALASATTGADVDPVLVALALDLPALRATRHELVPPLFAGLLPHRRRTAAAAAGHRSSAAPLDSRAQVVARLRQQVAGLLGFDAEQIDVSTPLTELGLDSVTAMRTRGLVETDFGRTVPISMLLNGAGVADIADLVLAAPAIPGHGAGDDTGKDTARVTEPDDEGTVFRPATRDVTRLLRAEQQGAPGVTHNIGYAVRLRRSTTRERLTEVLDSLAGRHAALRTAIVPDAEHGPRFAIARRPAGALLRWSTVGDDVDVDRKLRELMEQPFDLTVSPLWRFELLESPSGDQLLVYGAHHAVSDLPSLVLVAAEIDAALSGESLPTASSLDDVDRLLRAQPATHDRPATQWREQFTGIRRLELTLARPRPAKRTYRAATEFVEVPEGLQERITAQANRIGVTPAAFWLGTLTVFLARLRQRNRFVLAVPVDTRIHVDAPDAIGFFGVPIPFPAEARTGEPVTDVVRRTDSRLRAVLEKGASFFDTMRTLVEEGLYRENAPLVEVYFNYIRPQELKLRELEILPAGTGYSDLDLMITVAPGLGHVRLDYNLDIIDKASGAEFGRGFLALLAEVTGEPGAPALAQAGTSAPEAPSSVAVAATFALGNLSALVNTALDDTGLTVAEAPYHQVLAAAHDPSGVLAAPSTAVGVVLLRSADLGRFGEVTDELLDELGEEYPAALRAVADRTGRPLIVGVLPGRSIDERLRRWERRVESALRDHPGIVVLGRDRWRDPGVGEIFDERTDAIAHLPFRMEFQAVVALAIAEVVRAIRRPRPKVIAVDGDETLWGGVAGEIGPDRVDLAGARAKLARRLLEWHAAGVLLVLVSNNDEATVRAVLERPDSVLDAEHFAAISAGWAPKAERLEAVADELGLGLDTFLFLDDNPVEIAAMRATLPEVLSVTCPPADALGDFVTRLWPVAPRAATREDAARADFYRQEKVRREAMAQTSFAEFLARLGLEVELRPLSGETMERSVQLTRRTNQFNLRPSALHPTALAQWQQDGEVWTATAKDRFGDYGQIGVLAVRPDGGTLEVVAWLMSCRVLGRGAEERLLGWLAGRAEALGCSAVQLVAEHTSRNVPARRLVAALGGGEVDDPRLEVVVTLARLREFRSWDTWSAESPVEASAEVEAVVSTAISAVAEEVAHD